RPTPARSVRGQPRLSLAGLRPSDTGPEGFRCGAAGCLHAQLVSRLRADRPRLKGPQPTPARSVRAQPRLSLAGLRPSDTGPEGFRCGAAGCLHAQLVSRLRADRPRLKGPQPTPARSVRAQPRLSLAGLRPSDTGPEGFRCGAAGCLHAQLVSRLRADRPRLKGPQPTPARSVRAQPRLSLAGLRPSDTGPEGFRCGAAGCLHAQLVSRLRADRPRLKGPQPTPARSVRAQPRLSLAGLRPSDTGPEGFRCGAAGCLHAQLVSRLRADRPRLKGPQPTPARSVRAQPRLSLAGLRPSDTGPEGFRCGAAGCLHAQLVSRHRADRPRLKGPRPTPARSVRGQPRLSLAGLRPSDTGPEGFRCGAAGCIHAQLVSRLLADRPGLKGPRPTPARSVRGQPRLSLAGLRPSDTGPEGFR